MHFYRCALALFILLLPAPGLAQNATNPHYPVVAVDRNAGIIAIVDEINFRLPLSFERVLEDVPNANTLILHSPGGSVHAALAVASRVRSLGLRTVIRSGDRCFSACSMIFLAGTRREAQGELGVHQISSDSGNLVSGQFALADIIEVLGDFQVPTEVIAIMLRTPPEDMYVFSPEELRRYGLSGGAAPAPRPSQAPPSASVDYTNPNSWRGKTITGKLASNGKLWYSWLYANGRTVFQTTSGARRSGRYEIRGTSVCYLYDGTSTWACRTPQRVGGVIRWVDERGNFVSYIQRIDDTSLVSAAKARTLTATSVAEAIGPGNCALVVAARQTPGAARDYVRANISDQRFLQGYRGQNGWIAISIGNLKPDEVDRVLAEWKAAGRIPPDSYCSKGRNFVDLVDLRTR
ncbi:MAG: hypothetical protein AAFY38_03925 [Pseudomonadota bacterium]